MRALVWTGPQAEREELLASERASPVS